jgi:hypothetical protein
VASLAITSYIDPSDATVAADSATVYGMALTSDGSELVGFSQQIGTTPRPEVFRLSVSTGTVAVRDTAVPTGDTWAGGSSAAWVVTDPTGTDGTKPIYYTTQVQISGSNFGLLGNVDSAGASHTAGDITASVGSLPAAPNGMRVLADDLAGVAVYYTTGASVQSRANGLLGSPLSHSLPATGWDVLFAPPAGGGGLIAAAAMLTQDAHRRAAGVMSGGTGVQMLTSKVANPTFDSYTVVSGGTLADASLWFDRRTNRPRCLYGNGSGGILITQATKDGEQTDWPAAASVTVGGTAISGKYPIALRHPADPSRVICLYLDASGNLKAIRSLDGGDTWTALSTLATGLSFTSSGRAALCWMGEIPCAAYCSGSGILFTASGDGGATWGKTTNLGLTWGTGTVTVAASGPYKALSMVSFGGGLYLYAANSGGTAGYLWRSPDLGGTWAAVSGAVPAPPSTGAPLGVIRQSGRILVGTMKHTDNDGATFVAN